MAKALGSGLAIGGAMAAIVVAGVAIYSGIGEEIPPDVVSDVTVQAPAAPEVPEPAPEVTTPVPEVVEAAPVVTELEPEPDAVEAETETEVARITPKATADLTDTTKTVILPTAPSFDLVRVDETGAAVIAGKAAPNTTVEIILDGQVVGQATADATGAFVALIDLEPSDQPRELTLVEKPALGADLASVDKILVMPFAPEAKVAPKLVVAKSDTIEVIAPEQPPATPASDSETTETETTTASTTDQGASENTQVAASEGLSLDTILYDDLGDVVIAGRGNRDEFVRIYLDNEPAQVQKVSDDGQWKITLTDVPDGLYELRVDSVDSQGAVTERVESPLKREAAELVTDGTKPVSNITIQPGYTLWALAEQRYGSGTRYVQIFNANRDRIKDPDLIYPGQVFDLPN